MNGLGENTYLSIDKLNPQPTTQHKKLMGDD